jgi:transposase
MNQVKTLSFAGQNIYCGIDVHKKNWSVCIRDENFELKTFSQPPKAEALVDFLHCNYPQATYHAVYEAGFSGYRAQRILTQQGVECLIVHPADVPTTDKDRQQKTDRIDCRKLALALSDKRDKGMKSIHIPSEQMVDDRSILRTRQQLVQDQTRYKNRILSWLNFYGLDIPEGYKNSSHFSNKFIGWLEHLQLSSSAKASLQLKVDTLKQIRIQLLQANRHIRHLADSDFYKAQVVLLRSIPGIGLINAMIFLTELGDVRRFKNLDKLCNYVGLTPNIYSSDETVHVKGITHRCNHILREALIESAWCTVRKDPALLMAYKEYVKRMNYNKAIVKIAKKLLNRIRYVLLHQTSYVTGVVQ